MQVSGLGRFKITKGPEQAPIRELVYGLEGVGKTTFGADAPGPIFLGEEGSRRLDVSRFPTPSSWRDVLEGIEVLYREKHAFKTLVLDTLDFLEPLVLRDVCAAYGKKSIEDFGFGKGYVMALERWNKLLALLEQLQRSTSMGVILLAHAQLKKFLNPSGEDYERYVLKIHERAAAVVKGWAESVLFASYEVEVRKGDRHAKAKAVGGARWLYAQRRPTFDAKNRYGLPERLELAFAEFERLRGRAGSEVANDLRQGLKKAVAQIADQGRRDRAEAALAAAKDVEDLRRVVGKVNATLAEQDEREAEASRGETGGAPSEEPEPAPSPPAPETVQAPASPPREERHEAREIARPAPKAAPEDDVELRKKLRGHLYALVTAKHGRLDTEAASVKARAACGVASVKDATNAQLEHGIAVLAALPDHVEPKVSTASQAAVVRGPVEPYTAAAGIARGLSPATAEKLAAALGDDKVSLAELVKVHSRAALAAAKAAVGIPAGSSARDAAEGRLVVMQLPLVATKAAADVPAPVAPTRAEVLARKLGGSPHAAAVAAELAAAEASRTKGSAASDLCTKVCDLLKARLGLDAWDALSRAHAGLWEGDHPTLGGVLALVDAAPDEVTT